MPDHTRESQKRAEYTSTDRSRVAARSAMETTAVTSRRLDIPDSVQGGEQSVGGESWSGAGQWLLQCAAGQLSLVVGWGTLRFPPPSGRHVTHAGGLLTRVCRQRQRCQQLRRW